MKCPICGKEEFIESPWFPMHVSGDATLECKELKSFVCCNCGYLIFVNTGIKEILYANKTKIEIISNKITEKEAEIERLKKVLKGKDDHNTLYKIQSHENEILNMRREISIIKDMFKPALQEVKPVKRLSDFEKDQTFDAKRIWKILISVYENNDFDNSNTLSISNSVAKSLYMVMTIYQLAKERGYRPYSFPDGKTLIVKDEKEKQELKKSKQNIYTFDEFIKTHK